MEENNVSNLIASMLPSDSYEKLDFSIFGKMLSGEEEEVPYFDQTAENMFPEEFVPEETPDDYNVMDELGNFIPSMFPDSTIRDMGELGIIPKFNTNDSAIPDFDLLSRSGANSEISEDLLKKIENIANTIQSQSETQKKITNQLANFKPTFNPYGAVNVLDKSKKISATLGYDEDIRVFLGNIKNPPEWRVLD